MYKTKKYETEIAVEDYLEGYVDVEEFLGYCRECKNFGKIWSCPPYHFDVMEYWRKYHRLKLTAVKIIYDYENEIMSEQEKKEFFNEVITMEKNKLSEELMKKEKDYPGSISLGAGACIYCRNGCSRKNGAPCRFPDKMRYSLESLGANVGLTLSRLMHIELQWMEENKMPDYFVLVGGLLI